MPTADGRCPAKLRRRPIALGALSLNLVPGIFRRVRRDPLCRADVTGSCPLQLLCGIVGCSLVWMVADHRTDTISESDYRPTTFVLLNLHLELADMRQIGHGTKPPSFWKRTGGGYPHG